MTPDDFYALGKAYGWLKLAPEPGPPNRFGEWVSEINVARLALLRAAEEIARDDG